MSIYGYLVCQKTWIHRKPKDLQSLKFRSKFFFFGKRPYMRSCSYEALFRFLAIWIKIILILLHIKTYGVCLTFKVMLIIRRFFFFLFFPDIRFFKALGKHGPYMGLQIVENIWGHGSIGDQKIFNLWEY